MSLIESRLNSIAAIAIETSLKSATVDYINNNFVSKTDNVTALNNKQNSIIEAPATITLGQPDDYTYFVDSTSKSYPLFSSEDIVWSKSNNNISLNISSDFKNKYLTTTAASELYAHADELSTFETTTSLLNSVYQTITGMSSYVTTGSIANTLTSYLTINNANSTYQLLGNYLTSGSLTNYQLLGNYLTSGSLTNYQLLGNYLTSGSLTNYQLSGNYLTSGSLTNYQLLGNYLTSGSLTDYQTIANMANYITSGSLTNYQLSGNYLTSGSLLNYATISSIPNNYLTSGSLLNYATISSIPNNYLTSGSLLNYATIRSIPNDYLTSGSLLNYATISSIPNNYLTSGSLLNYAPINNPTFSGTVVAPAITLNGNDIASFYQPKFIVAGYVQANGTFGASYGRVGFTSTRSANGAYVITFSSNIGATLYAVVGGLRNAAGYISYNGTAATGVNIQTYSTNGTQADNQFNFYILS